MRVLLLLGFLACAGCTTVTIKHKIPPIYATVNINIRIQKELEDMFDFEETRAPVAEDAGSGDEEGGSR